MNTATEHASLELVEQAKPAQPVAVAQQTAMVVTPADLLRIAMDSGDNDIARLERLMAMDERYREGQERERQRQSVLAFRRDFAAFRGENIVIPKTRHVDRKAAGSFDQAEYHIIAERISPALARHGFSFRHDQRFGVLKVDGGDGATVPWVWVTCYLEHRDGHSEKLELEGPPGDLSANTPVQNMQVTASYLKRQSLLAITGTATGGEDDENQMRPRRPAGSDAPGEGDGPDPVLQAGHDAAMQGMKALTAWWGGLTNKQRGQWSKEFGQMRKAATMADERGA